MPESKEPRKRKPPARNPEVIIGALAERISMIQTHNETQVEADIARLNQLMDELRRSLRRGSAGEDADE